jgi:hypothetical protein
VTSHWEGEWPKDSKLNLCMKIITSTLIYKYIIIIIIIIII